MTPCATCPFTGCDGCEHSGPPRCQVCGATTPDNYGPACPRCTGET